MYEVPTLPALRGPLSSEQIRDEFGKIATELNQYPGVLGSGAKGFDGGTWNGATLNQPSIIGGAIGTTTTPAVMVSAYHIFNRTAAYPALTPGLVGLVRSMDGKLNLIDGPNVTLFTDNARNLVMGSGAAEMLTTSGSGFFYLPTVNGLATGTPTSYIGGVAAVYDRAANKIGVYNGGWKWTSALT